MSSKNREYQEKRNFIRMKVDTAITIKIVGEDDSYNGICRDLSGGGMLVELATALPIGTHVEVYIESSHGHSPILKAKAEITRIIAQPGSDESSCLVGMEVLSMID
ncbi:MAG: c-di-GMP-binding flagellar brake protein YcgR [Flavobacteriales bacterium]|jgi:c-di-GMP-binding flagellar brake protein YcgR